MAVARNESDQQHASGMAAAFEVTPSTAGGGGPTDERTGASRTAAIGAIRARTPRAEPPFVASGNEVGDAERTDVRTTNGHVRPERAPEPVDESAVWARDDLMRWAKAKGRAAPEPELVEQEPDDEGPVAAEADARAEPGGGPEEAEAAAETDDEDAGSGVRAAATTPPEVLDPYLKPALEAAAAARAAAARVRETTRIWAEVAVRPRYEPPVGLPLSAVMERRAIVFHPLRRASDPLPYRIDPAPTRPASHLTVPPYIRHETLRLDEPVRPSTQEDEPVRPPIEEDEPVRPPIEEEESEARASKDHRFTRFRAEVEMAAQQADEDPAHPWAGQVPVPIAQAAPRRSLWSRISRLFGGSDNQ